MKLTDKLLEYSRVGSESLSSAEIDMKLLFLEALDGLRASGERLDGVVLKPLPPARGDAMLVKQALIKLLANAIKFCSKREQPLIEVSGHGDGAECVYCVKDNGAGFDMKYYDKLFGVLQRLHSEEEFGGAGVGLAIVQRIVSRHGGRVWADGKVDEGAAFYFSLPKERSDAAYRISLPKDGAEALD
jgi:light-regulated signal transduction histidine kinase (bacteriophytochrome)